MTARPPKDRARPVAARPAAAPGPRAAGTPSPPGPPQERTAITPGVPSQDPPPGGTPGARTWVIELPANTELLTSNHRLHRMKAYGMTRELKNMAATLARAQQIPRLDQAAVLVSYLPPPRVKARRHPLASARVEDPDALTPTSKALIDGLTQAGVWAADTRKHVLRVTHQLEAGSCPSGRLRLHITEVIQ